MSLEIHLLRPWWLLAFFPLIWMLWRWSRHNTTNNVWRDLIDAHLMPHLLVGEPAPGTKLAVFLIGCGGTLGILALAGPVWERLPQPVYQVQSQRVIALDLSPTMNATDVSPSRLTQARFKILDLLARIKEGQTAMLAYGTEPFIVSPLTADAATIAAQIPNLQTDLLPTPGPRRPDLALTLAAKLLQQVASPNGEILLVTDGIDYAAATQERARQLRQQGYTISILGIGTEQGAPAPLGDGGFLKDDTGAIVISRLPTDELRQLAAISGGKYVTAELGDQDLESLLTSMATPNFQSSKNKEHINTDQWREEGPWLLLLLLPLAASAFRRGWLSPLLICITLLTPHSAQAFEWQDLWLIPDQQGAKQFAAGNPKEAAKKFQRSDWQAAAHYRAGDYAQALETLNQMPNEDMAYNKGNTLAQLGKFEEALNEYEKFLIKHPQDADAMANRDLMRKLLEQQKQQQKQEQQKQDQQKQDQQQDASSEKKQSSKSKNQDAKNTEQSPQSQSAPNEQSKSQNANSKADQTKSAQSKAQSEQKAESNSNEQKQQPSEKPSAKDLASQPESKSQQAKDTKNKEKSKSDVKDLQEMTAKQDSPENLKEREAHQAMNYMLNRVPDDPGGLLRQRFLLQHLRNRDLQ